MKNNSPRPKRLSKSFIAALTLVVGAIGLPLSSSHSQAQQEPNRQLVQTNAPSAANARRIALVIGNGTYATAPPLKNPPNDARDMAATLKLLGFSVSSAIDADQRTMKRLIREFGQQLKSGGQGLFYYAGHGVQMRGRNYLIPANADITSETDVEDQAVDLNLVLGLMDEAQNGLNIVILDACRNNPFTRSFRSAGNGLAQVDAPTGTLIAYATSPGRVASDGQGRNGLYTSELLSQMRVNGISVEEMFKRVRAGVQRQTNGQQVPWESSSLVGNFYFAAPKTTETNTGNSSGAESRVAVDTAAFELSYWDTIKNSTHVDDYKAYLEKYPNGQFAALAKNRIASLDALTKPAESKPAPTDGAMELAFWDSVKNSNRVGDFQAYLKRYPSGAFTDLASNRIAELETAARERETSGAVKKNSLEGTTWKGDSSGGDKHYEFQFLPNGAVVWRLGWGRLNNPTYQGTWRRTGNIIHMEFPEGQPFGASPVEAEINGDKMSGSWNFGRSGVRPDNGMYKFTIEKAPTTGTGDVPKSTNAPAKPKAVQNKYGIEMVYIPPGEFMMGSENGEKDQQPVHRVTISQAFYIGKYEVTQAQWQAAMGNNPSKFKGDNKPVERVSWLDAQEFIQKLNQMNDGYAYRLPTEAEWEYACRAGTTGDYPGSLDSMAWYIDNSGHQTHVAGQQQSNGFGLYDVHGNVWEWCEDWYHKTYAGAPMDGSAWLGGAQKYRVLRGGSWFNVALALSSANRYRDAPDYRGDAYGGVGFRVVAVLRTN